MNEETSRDLSQVFWNTHYSQFVETEPTDFAINFATKYINPNTFVIELGCGNGRDARALALNSKGYLGLDISEQAINACRQSISEVGAKTNNLEFRVFDFTKISELLGSYDQTRLLIYSRFTLHSITYIQQKELLEALSNQLSAQCSILFETRTIYDELYGKGNLVEKDAYMSDHFRRFINPEDFRNEIVENFQITEWLVENNFAKYGEENPIVLRVAIKPS